MTNFADARFSNPISETTEKGVSKMFKFGKKIKMSLNVLRKEWMIR